MWFHVRWALQWFAERHSANLVSGDRLLPPSFHCKSLWAHILFNPAPKLDIQCEQAELIPSRTRSKPPPPGGPQTVRAPLTLCENTNPSLCVCQVWKSADKDGGEPAPSQRFPFISERCSHHLAQLFSQEDADAEDEACLMIYSRHLQAKRIWLVTRLRCLNRKSHITLYKKLSFDFWNVGFWFGCILGLSSDINCDVFSASFWTVQGTISNQCNNNERWV